MNTLKFLAFFRLYITYIFQVRVQHYLSTKLVQIKRMLRLFFSAFYAIGIEFSSGSLRAIPIKTRCRLDENPMKCKNSAGIGRVMLCCIALVFQSSNYSFKVLKSIRALALLALMVSMFSLSAQTPRKDSGADGPIKVEPLLVGQKLSEEFWKREYLVYNNGDTTRQTLEAYRGKLLVLDFWATWCAICLGQMKEKDELFNRFPADAKLIYVNPAQTKDTYTNIVKIQDRLAERSLSGKFQSIIEEDYLQQLFPNHIYPRYVWIGPRGDLIGLTLALSVTDGHIKDMLNLINPKDGKK